VSSQEPPGRSVAPDVPANERARLAELHALHILDTPPEPGFESLVAIASELCDTPIALISLVDSERQWFKARVGLAAEQTPREISFCGHAILGHELFEISDALKDPRFATNPLVTDDPSIRFYAGVPLITEQGSALGTLCVIDRKPRRLSPRQRSVL